MDCGAATRYDFKLEAARIDSHSAHSHRLACCCCGGLQHAGLHAGQGKQAERGFAWHMPPCGTRTWNV